LRALPEEWTYDYKTADETYIKAAWIAQWMQFPDSQFLPFNDPTQELMAHVNAIPALAAKAGLFVGIKISEAKK